METKQNKSVMKTNREWFESWEQYGMIAIEEAEEQYLNSLDAVSASLKDALACSFIWSNSTQGHDFWETLAKSL